MRKLKKSGELLPCVRYLARLLAAWTGCGVLGAATYFIAPDGNDSKAGSISAPYKTVARASRQAAPGDTIVLKDGVYGNAGRISDGSGGMHDYVAQAALAKAGSPNAWITIKAQHKGKAVLDCGTSPAGLGCDTNLYLQAGAAYWSIEDVVFTGGAFGGIGANHGASHIRIKGCEFYNIGNWNNPTQIGEAGVGFDRTAVDWRIEGNVFHEIGRIGGSGLDHGIYAAGTQVTVVNNVFYGLTHGWAIQISDGASQWLIANNTFAFPNPTRDGQIMLWNRNSGITIRNNIFYEPRGYAIARYESRLNGCWLDHNVVYGAQRIVADLGDCSVRDNQIGMDPRFVNPTRSANPAKAAFDFHLQAGSPAIGAGVRISNQTTSGDEGRHFAADKPAADKVDAGAYPFGAVSQ